MGSRVYAGRSASTRKERVVYSCACGERFPVDVHRAVEAGHAEEVRRLAEGTLNRVRCPQCGTSSDVQVPVLFHDGGAARLILVLPEGLRHRELAERAALFAALAEDAAVPPPYVLTPDVVFGAAGLRTALAPHPTVATPAQRAPAAATAPQRSPAATAPQRSSAAAANAGAATGAAAANATVPTATAATAPTAPAPATPGTVDQDKTQVTDLGSVDRNHPSLALLPSLTDEE